MKIEPDTWLGENLGYDAYRIVETNQSPSLSKEDITSHSCIGSSFFHVKVPVIAVGIVHSLCNAGFRVVDVNVTFEREPDLYPVSCAKSSPVTIRSAQGTDHDRLLDIAGSCFVYSRFHLDPYIPADLADTIKREWVANYLRGGRGNGVIVAELEGRPIGFLADLHAVQNGQKIRVIDLIGVDNVYQNCGVGKQLVSHFINTAVGRFSVLRVGTQIANIPSLRFYDSCRFKIVDAAYVLHAHVRDDTVI